MKKIIAIVLGLLLLLIIFNFNSCGSNKENFSDDSSNNSSNSADFNINNQDCRTICEIKYGFGPEFDQCIENCGS